MPKYIVTDPTFSGFVSGEPKAYKLASRAMKISNGTSFTTVLDGARIEFDKDEMIVGVRLPNEFNKDGSPSKHVFKFHVSEILDITDDENHKEMVRKTKRSLGK